MALHERKRRPARGGADRWQADHQLGYATSGSPATDEIARANLPWDGRWGVEPPADYIGGLYRISQITARELLDYGVGTLSEAEARFLQVVAYQWRPLSNLQRHWLVRLERQHGSIAA